MSFDSQALRLSVLLTRWRYDGNLANASGTQLLSVQSDQELTNMCRAAVLCTCSVCAEICQPYLQCQVSCRKVSHLMSLDKQ